VQISGRVGRKKDAPEGRVIYLAKHNNVEIEESIKDIRKANQNLQNLF
jgi:late competence protein required for DNA uptake (superfamily II DNA/RNA helicase)